MRVAKAIAHWGDRGDLLGRECTKEESLFFINCPKSGKKKKEASFGTLNESNGQQHGPRVRVDKAVTRCSDGDNFLGRKYIKEDIFILWVALIIDPRTRTA